MCVFVSKCPLQIFKAAGTPDSLTRATLALYCKHPLSLSLSLSPFLSLSHSLSLSLCHTLTVNLISSFFSVSAHSQSDSTKPCSRVFYLPPNTAWNLTFYAMVFSPGTRVFSAATAENLAVQYLDVSHLFFPSAVRLQP